MLVILCAEEEEAKHINCKRAKVIVTGVGVVNIIKNLSKIPPKAKIINVGYAGSNQYAVGSVLSVSRVERLYKPSIINETAIDLIPCYTNDLCYTVDDFLNTTVYKDIPLIDMELYYLAARFPNIQSLKIVSDNMNLTQHRAADFEESWELVNKILAHL